MDQAIKEAGKAPSSKERAKIQHMLMPIANHIATRLLYTEVAERARANPKAPGHQAMEHVLKSKKEMSEIESSVKNKLVNIHSGAWAQEVCSAVACVGGLALVGLTLSYSCHIYALLPHHCPLRPPAKAKSHNIHNAKINPYRLFPIIRLQ